MLKIVGNYKEPLIKIPVEGGYGYYGLLLSTDNYEKLQCHICGELHSVLSAHIYRKHKVLPREYKKRFGLAYSTKLMSLSSITGNRQRYRIWWNSLSQSEKNKLRAIQNMARAKGRKKMTREMLSHPLQTEHLLRRGATKEAVLEKIKEIQQKIFKTPTLDEFVTHCGTQSYKHYAFKLFGSWNNAVIAAGFQPNPIFKASVRPPRYLRRELMEYIVEFSKRFKRAPSGVDFGHGILPNAETYVSRFGSIEKAREKSGIYSFVPKINRSRKGMRYLLK